MAPKRKVEVDPDDQAHIEWLDPPGDVLEGDDVVEVPDKLAEALQEILELADAEEGE